MPWLIPYNLQEKVTAEKKCDPQQLKSSCAYILMVHVAKEFDLSKCPLRINPVVKCISNFLDRNLLIGLRVFCAAAK